jgi:hypothetical protein
MLAKHKDFHLERLSSNIMVRQPISYHPIDVKNIYGQYWAVIGEYVAGLHDVRARQGTFTNPWSMASNKLFAAPPIRVVNNSLSDLLDRRACELLATQRKIAVMWSGGIDSTCVLSSLIKNASRLDQLVIYLTNVSIIENPVFYKKFIENKIECRNTASIDVTDEFINSHILLNGDPGDCLYGPSMPMYKHLQADRQQLLPWRENRNLIMEGIDNYRAKPGRPGVWFVPGFANWYVNKVSDNIEEVGIYDINTIADWWWWHYFNLKWEFSILRPFYGLRKNQRSTISLESVQSYVDTTFYNTEYFQNWSYTNLSRLCHDPKNHKIDAKQYIFKLDHNESYLQTKGKLESVYTQPWDMPAYLGKDFKSYYLTDPGCQEAMFELLEQYTG